MRDFEKFDAYDKVDVTWSDRTSQSRTGGGLMDSFDDVMRALDCLGLEYEKCYVLTNATMEHMSKAYVHDDHGKAYASIEDTVCGDALLTIRCKYEQAAWIMSAFGDAERIVTAHGAVGHCNCSKCGGRIDTCDAWCRHCGSRLIETKYTMEDES